MWGAATASSARSRDQGGAAQESSISQSEPAALLGAGPRPLDDAPQPWWPPIEIIASPRRRRTVQARLRNGVLELLVPASMSDSERLMWAERMRSRIERQLARSAPTDAGLERRARELNRQLFGGRLRWNSLAFANQTRRWGSCTYTAGVIRIAERAARLPSWVLDYLLVHELAHLEHPDHGPGFWQAVNRYRMTERARGYLMALDHQAGDEGMEVD